MPDPSVPPLVSTVIPTYNYAQFLPQAIDSALAQDYPNMEVIVGDDGSTDQTPEVMKAYAGRVNYLRLPHRGVSATRNAILAAAHGKYVAMLDADDLWLPGKIALQVQAMEARPAAGLCHGGYVIFGGSEPEHTHVVQDPAARYQGMIYEKNLRWNDIATLTVMVRRSAVPGHGFHPELRIAQDFTLWQDIIFYHPVIYLPQVLSRYRKHPEQKTAVGNKRIQLWQAPGRMKSLDFVRKDLGEPEYQRLRQWTLERLREDTYDRYWRGDYRMADQGLQFMRQYGLPVPWTHRLKAALLGRLQARQSRRRAR